MKDYEDEAFDELEKAQQRKVEEPVNEIQIVQGIPFFTPPKRKPLTDEQIWDLHIKMSAALNCKLSDLIELTRAVEAAHSIKE